MDFGNHLIVLEKNYVLFFKKNNITSNVNGKKETDAGLSSYCHSNNPSKVFDGTSKDNCVFPGENLKEAYDRLRSDESSGREYLNKTMPLENVYYHIDDKSVIYKWHGAKSLEISVVMDNESVTYSFSELPTETDLAIITDAEY
ncbi:hypothetical protein [Buttiauxella noackiae]|uniref:hypothetical protein n=1 Tax=Buttiauxella noackiae TaxID=82992 RepID=UPI00054D87EE|nr:hypothetical protein [Buttiauxella noackiae]